LKVAATCRDRSEAEEIKRFSPAPIADLVFFGISRRFDWLVRFPNQPYGSARPKHLQPSRFDGRRGSNTAIP
jgi:hypothetical protein